MKRAISLILCLITVFSLVSCSGEGENTDTTAPTETEPQFLCEADSGKVRVISMSAADGIFVEDGRKVEVKQTASIIVQNMGSQMLADAELWFKVNEDEYATFVVMALPAGEKCVVMEKTAKTLNANDKYTLDPALCKFAYSNAVPEDKNVDIQTEGSTIRITNKTDSVLSTRITYRYYMGDMCYGGIAFTGEFKDIKPGETMEKTSSYFGDDCRIVGVSDNLVEDVAAP